MTDFVISTYEYTVTAEGFKDKKKDKEGDYTGRWFY